MIVKTTNQTTIFDINNVLPGLFDEDDWANIFRKHIYPLIDEDKFSHFYHKSIGRPNAPIKTTVSILIFMGMEKLTWREAEEKFSRRADWWLATNTNPYEATIDHTTLFKFYKKLEQDETALELFYKLNKRFMEYCGTSYKKQRTDSFFMHGWLEKLSRYGLLKETNRLFLQNLRKHKPELYQNIKNDLSRDYLEKKFDLTEKDAEKVKRQIKVLAKDMYMLKQAFENDDQVRNYKTFQVLDTVFEQQCELVDTDEESDDGSNSPKINIREKPKGDNIINTPHNPDARYIKKGNQEVIGQKAVITETCDKSNETQFIVDVDVVPANESDTKQTPKIQKRLEEIGNIPDDQYVDAAFSPGVAIMHSWDKGIELHGPTCGRSQSMEAFNSPDRQYDVADFNVTVNPADRSIMVESCPEEHPPINQSISDKTGHILVHFDTDVCTNCKSKHRCPVTVGKRTTSITFKKSSYFGAVQHHKYMSDKEYRQEYSIRAGVEATVSELTRSHGLRKSRHRTEKRTRLQAIFGSLACNMKRFFRHVKNYGITLPETSLNPT